MRLFVAIELEQSVRAALRALQQALGPSCRGVRWVKPDLLHLTLKFLGDVDDPRAVEVAQAVAAVGRAIRPFEMSLVGCGCFPARGEVRIVWAGVEEPTGALLGCVDRLEGALEKLGFEAENRMFSPHITVGRVREDRSRGSLRTAVAAARFGATAQDVTSVVVMSSELSRNGPTYTVVSRAALGAQAPGQNKTE